MKMGAGEPVAELIDNVSRSRTNLSGLDTSPDVYQVLPWVLSRVKWLAKESRTGALCFSIRHNFHYRFRGLQEPWPGFE